MKNYVSLFACTMILQLVGMDSHDWRKIAPSEGLCGDSPAIAVERKKDLTRQVPLCGVQLPTYNELIENNAYRLKSLLAQEESGCFCEDLNRAIMVLCENKKTIQRVGYLSSYCDAESEDLVNALTNRAVGIYSLNEILKNGSVLSVRVCCNSNKYMFNAYSLCSDYGCVTPPLHYVLWCHSKYTYSAKDTTAKVKFLLDKGANPNGVDANGDTPLHKACTQEHLELLLAKGARLDTQNYEGLTPAMEHVHAAELLLSQPVARGRRQERQKMALFLIEKGASTESKDKYGNTLLLQAFKAELLDVIQVILDRRLSSRLVFNMLREIPTVLMRSTDEIKKIVQNRIIDCMNCALFSRQHDVVQAIITQFPWVDYTSIFIWAQEVGTPQELEKAKMLRLYLDQHKLSTKS